MQRQMPVFNFFLNCKIFVNFLKLSKHKRRQGDRIPVGFCSLVYPGKAGYKGIKVSVVRIDRNV